EKLDEIKKTFAALYPIPAFGTLAEKISAYWNKKLTDIWKNKPSDIREKDLSYDPADPLCRIMQKTVVIAYADSVFDKGKKTLATLDSFLCRHFPAVGGLHLLPSCEVCDERFNDGYFSQVVRDRIHPRFGSNELFADMMKKYFSMTDFVLNHVDIEHPEFKAYLSGDDAAGRCFYVFSEPEYLSRKKNGDFDNVFRPRPFPLFSIFRRRPKDGNMAKMDNPAKANEINRCIAPDFLPEPVIGLLSIFSKIRNDQMLSDEDYKYIVIFREHLASTGVDPDILFTISTTQETGNIPYIFNENIRTQADLLFAAGYERDAAERIGKKFVSAAPAVFGEEIRALTTFSHVQVDLNTTTFEGLCLLADDFAWYLSMDMNMLRLDAANFAFKKWKTSCFGLPEVKLLMKILYLSMECVSPRIVANLEVNDRLSSILEQMADNDAPPPMMYDFHLPSLLPVVVNETNADILAQVPRLIDKYDIPAQSIRFSLAESHDGKSVRGSLDFLTIARRQALADIVEKNGGKIKYKAVPSRRCTKGELYEIKSEISTAMQRLLTGLFTSNDQGALFLKDSIQSVSDMAKMMELDEQALKSDPVLAFFANRLLFGKEPYELCVTTRNCLAALDDPKSDAARFLSFYTLAFAMMGRNVKSIYFNDLLGLENDYVRMEKTGELRDIKRTRSELDALEKELCDKNSLRSLIARGINGLIEIVDSDPALHFTGNEAEYIGSGSPCVALVLNHCGRFRTLVAINLSDRHQEVLLDPKTLGLEAADELADRFTGRHFIMEKVFELKLEPYERMWLARG
ncbi:MAG: hypothetical protein GXP53_05145, partial [Deltaproteobacteria bacterium]|nr:hypothetical protein [Deltaproteobacteria bacterium]